MTPDLQPSPSYFDIQRQQEPIAIDFSSYEVGKNNPTQSQSIQKTC